MLLAARGINKWNDQRKETGGWAALPRGLRPFTGHGPGSLRWHRPARHCRHRGPAARRLALPVRPTCLCCKPTSTPTHSPAQRPSPARQRARRDGEEQESPATGPHGARRKDNEDQETRPGQTLLNRTRTVLLDPRVKTNSSESWRLLEYRCNGTDRNDPGENTRGGDQAAGSRRGWPPWRRRGHGLR